MTAAPVISADDGIAWRETPTPSESIADSLMQLPRIADALEQIADALGRLIADSGEVKDDSPL